LFDLNPQGLELQMVLAVNLNPRAQPRLKPERVERGSFRSAEALLPRMNAVAPTDQEGSLVHRGGLGMTALILFFTSCKAVRLGRCYVGAEAPTP
jgi:hypothetical protein